MKYIFFILLGSVIGFFIPSMLNPKIALDKNHMMLKSYGLGVCMNTHLLEKNKMRSDIGEALGGYFQLIEHYGSKDMLQVESYFEKKYDSVKGVSKITNRPMVFMGCMKIYNSKELDEFIFNLIPTIQKG